MMSMSSLSEKKNQIHSPVAGGKWKAPWSSLDCYFSMDCTDLVYYLMDDSISKFIVLQWFLFFCFSFILFQLGFKVVGG